MRGNEGRGGDREAISGPVRTLRALVASWTSWQTSGFFFYDCVNWPAHRRLLILAACSVVYCRRWCFLPRGLKDHAELIQWSITYFTYPCVSRVESQSRKPDKEGRATDLCGIGPFVIDVFWHTKGRNAHRRPRKFKCLETIHHNRTQFSIL